MESRLVLVSSICLKGLLIVAIIFATINFTSSDDPMESCYFNQISKIKKEVYGDNIDKALHLYDNLFKKDISPLYVDIKNAYILSKRAKNNSLQLKFLEMMSQKGVTVDFFYQSFNSTSFSKEDSALISSIFPTEYLANDYSQLLDKMYNDDQKVRPLKAKISLEEKALRDSTDLIHFNQFLKLVEKYSFPSEENCGVILHDADLWYTLSTLTRHFAQIGKGKTILDLMLSSESLIPPQIIGGLADLIYTTEKDRSFNVQCNYLTLVGAHKCRPFIEYSKANISKINSNRLEIGLDSLHISSRYFLCGLFCSDGLASEFVFEPYTGVDQIPYFLFDSPEGKKEIVENKIDFEKTLPNCPCTIKSY